MALERRAVGKLNESSVLMVRSFDFLCINESKKKLWETTRRKQRKEQEKGYFLIEWRRLLSNHHNLFRDLPPSSERLLHNQTKHLAIFDSLYFPDVHTLQTKPMKLRIIFVRYVRRKGRTDVPHIPKRGVNSSVGIWHCSVKNSVEMYVVVGDGVRASPPPHGIRAAPFPSPRPDFDETLEETWSSGRTCNRWRRG